MKIGSLLRLLVFAAVGFGLVTWVALEGGDVAKLRTHPAEGGWRTTRVWWVQDGDALWIEAATQERPWLTDVEADPNVELEREGRTTAWRATPVPGQDAHDRIRALLAEKYGWADWWVGLIQDTSQSIAVRLQHTPGRE